MNQVLIHDVECGPASLREITPVAGKMLTLLPDPDGARQLCIQLASPVRYRLPRGAEAPTYPLAPFGQDASGPFLWVYYLALHPRVPGVDPSRPARDVPIDVSYILDPTAGQGDVLDTRKIVWVATAFLDHLAADLRSPHEADASAPGIGSGDEARDGAGLDAKLGRALAQLRVFVGSSAATVPRPRLGSLNTTDTVGATYTVNSDGQLRYRAMDPHTGCAVERVTRDEDELVYWVVDDAARALAWTQAYRAPAAADLSTDALKVRVALPLWAAFVTAVNPEWGLRTQASIDELLRGAGRTVRSR